MGTAEVRTSSGSALGSETGVRLPQLVERYLARSRPAGWVAAVDGFVYWRGEITDVQTLDEGFVP